MRSPYVLVLGLTAACVVASAREARADQPPLVRATDDVATPPPPPPPAVATNPPPKERKRWYGWQILILHGITDALTTGGLFVSYASQAGGLGMTLTAIGARSIGSLVIEGAHGNGVILPGLANFLAPLAGAGLLAPLTAGERGADEDIAPGLGQGFAVGALLGGSLVTAVEASLLFDRDTRPIEIGLSPTGASMRITF